MPRGSKSWVLRFMLNGKSRTMGLGAYGDGSDGISLGKARELAAEARSLVKRRIDPIIAREQAIRDEEAAAAQSIARSKTFKEVALEYGQGQEAGWKNQKHRAQWLSTPETYAFPILGCTPVVDVDAALAVLAQVMPLPTGKDALVFPSTGTKTELSDMALSMLVRGMNEVPDDKSMPWQASDGRPIIVHGFRSTFRDWCEEATSTPRSVSEAALAHAIESKVEVAYDRTDHFEKRRILMAQWADHCFGLKPA